MSPTKRSTKPARNTAAVGKKKSGGFTDEERAAMNERAGELKAEARRGSRADKADGESDVLAKIAEMDGPDRALAERLHAIVTASAPGLTFRARSLCVAPSFPRPGVFPAPAAKTPRT